MVRLLTPLILCLFGLTISVYSYITYADFDSYGAAFYPTIIGALVSVFSLVDFVMEFKMKKAYIFQSFDLGREFTAAALVLGVILFYIFFSETLGFIITASVIFMVMVLPLVKKNRILTALFLILVAVGIYLLFAKVLQVSLPAGIFFE